MPATTPNPGPYDLGPFQELVGIQWGAAVAWEGQITTVQDTPDFLAYTPVSASPCDVLDAFAGSPDAYQTTRFQFSLTNPAETRTYAQILAGTFTGVTSGATWTPNTYHTASPALHCEGSIAVFVPTDYQDISTFRIGAQLIEMDVEPFALNADAVNAIINYGRFLLPPLGFIQGEQFTWTPGP